MAAHFHTTRWTLVRRASGGDAAAPRSEVRAALGELIQLYWPALHAFTRRGGHSPQDAEDLVQGFLARLIETKGMEGVDSTRGTFRSYLLGALKHYISHVRSGDRALKRGGGVPAMSLDFAWAEGRLDGHQSDEAPEAAFDRAWAGAVLRQARQRLREEAREAGTLDRFDHLAGWIGSSPEPGAYAALAARFGVTEVSLKVAVHRLRKRFGECVREEIEQTTDGSVDDELEALLAAVRTSPETVLPHESELFGPGG